MPRNSAFIALRTATALLLFALLVAPSRAAEPAFSPGTVLWEGAHLAHIREGKFRDGDLIARALESLQRRADKALKNKPYSVVTHGELPPSGDPHDYVSFGTYWWPNPDTSDGLPYVRRDGITNGKLIAQGDRPQLVALRDDVVDLSLAGYLLKDEKYSEQGVKLLRTWFLDPATRMNPHLRHGQLIRGINTGRPVGIIDTKDFVWCLEAARLLEQFEGWTTDDREGLQRWFREYLHWLLHDPMGKKEGAARNNHATYYDLQVVSMALYVGDRSTARRVLQDVKQRIATHIEPTGQQPHEAARTLGLGYSVMNLRGFCYLARLGEEVEIDLWDFATDDRRSLRAAADYLLPYMVNPATWPHQQIKRVGRPWPAEMGYLLASRYDEPKFLDLTTDKEGNASPHDLAPLVFKPLDL